MYVEIKNKKQKVFLEQNFTPIHHTYICINKNEIIEAFLRLRYKMPLESYFLKLSYLCRYYALCNFILQTVFRGQCYDFKNIFAEKRSFLTQITAI
jgi:hypothetical protein